MIVTTRAFAFPRNSAARHIALFSCSLAVIGLGACANEPQQLTNPSPQGLRFGGHGGGTVGGNDGRVVVCVDLFSPTGHYTFTVSDVTVGAGGTTTVTPSPVSVAQGGCANLVVRESPADESNPDADPVTSVTFSYSGNDVAGGADYVSTGCVTDGDVPASPCSTTVTASMNFVSGSAAVFSFVNTAGSPGALIAALRLSVSTLGLPKGIAKDLDGKLAAALEAVDSGRIDAACKELAHVISKTTGESGKKIAPADATDIVAEASAIEVALGC